jgi:hypothetical protein
VTACTKGQATRFGDMTVWTRLVLRFGSHRWNVFVRRRLPLDGQQKPRVGVPTSLSVDFHCAH